VTPRFVGRAAHRPYTRDGIRRRLCAKCGERRATSSWQACANGRRHVAVCPGCDRSLNRVVLRWLFGARRAGELMSAYREPR